MTLNELTNNYIDVANMIEELTAQRDALKAAILEQIGDTETTYIGGHIITNKAVESSRMDNKKLSGMVSAEILDACRVKVCYNRFTIK